MAMGACGGGDMSKEQIEKEIEEMAHSLRIRKLDNEKIGFDVLSRLAGMAYEDEENSIARHIVTQLGYRKMPDDIGDFSDGYHTFNELYHHRAVLFSVICNMFSEKAWKSKLHDTGDMYDGMFIVGIETEQGQATYHYDIEPYWDMFKVKELEKAPKYDGHTPSDAIERIGNIKQSEGEWITKHRHRGGFRTVTVVDSFGEKHTGMVDERWECDDLYCSVCGKISHDAFLNYCANCGARMKGGGE
jgi:hypothetical protein